MPSFEGNTQEEMPRRVRGARDIFSGDFRKHQLIVDVSWRLAKAYGFSPLSTPILEYTEIFSKTLGESSDVVSKEMYSFLDRGGENLTLRPEFTAGIMRSVFSLPIQLPSRLFSHGPLFRRERPQAGRHRQFHQVNFECMGFKGPLIDAELAKLVCSILEELGLASKVSLRINSLGCRASRSAYQRALVDYLSANESLLSEGNRRRLALNPLRVLDSKEDQDREIIQSAPLIESFYSVDALKQWESFRCYLDMYGIKYELDPNLVRGLDYYSGPVFELVSSKLGAQSSLGGGGRYDELAKLMYGNKDVPAAGCALGIERVALLLEEATFLDSPSIVLLPVKDCHVDLCVELSQKLRADLKVPLLLEVEGKLSSRMKKADLLNASYAIFVGDDEAIAGSFKIRDLKSGEEKMLAYDMLLKCLSQNGN